MKKYILTASVALIVMFTGYAKYGDQPMEAPDNMRLDQWAYLTAHNAYSSKEPKMGVWGKYPFYHQQRTSITDQLTNYGVRGLMYDIHIFDPKAILEDLKDEMGGLFGKASDFMTGIFAKAKGLF